MSTAYPRVSASASASQEPCHLVCLHAAVARRTGTVPFGVNGEIDDESGRFGGIPVEAHSIDDMARRHGPPDVVFMDVEGYEGEALRGATELSNGRSTGSSRFTLVTA